MNEGEEIARTTSSKKCSDERTAQLYSTLFWKEVLPSSLYEIVMSFNDDVIKILDYLDNHHFQEILAYAHSRTGKLTIKNRVENQLKSGKRRSLRTIARNLSPIPTEKVRVILDQFINSGWALLCEDGLYSKA